jgi:hypothetical protein
LPDACIFDAFHARIASILDKIAGDGRLPNLDYARFVVEPPKEAALGDLASNAINWDCPSAAGVFQWAKQRPALGQKRAFADGSFAPILLKTPFDITFRNSRGR